MSPPPSHERSVARLLRAYPPRYLDVRRAELVDLLHDLADPDDERLSWATRIDLVRGGLQVRRRDRPPYADRQRYRWFAMRLDPRWALWVRDDIASPTYVMRRWIFAMSPILIGSLRASHGTGGALPLFEVVVFGATLLLALILGRGRIRRLARKRHGITVGGAILPQPTLAFFWTETPRRVRQVWPTLLTLGLMGPVGAACITAVVHAAPRERVYFGGGFSISDDTTMGEVVPYVLLGGIVLGFSALVFTWRLGPRLRGRLLLQAVPIDQAEPARPLRVAVIALAVISLSVAGGWLLFLPPPYALALVAAGACTSPSFVVAALVARRAEQHSKRVVTLTELKQALAGRPVIGQPPTERKVVPMPRV